MSKQYETALEILANYKDTVWQEIEKYLSDPEFPQVFEIPKKFEYLRDFHWEIVSEYPKRKGKYLRPSILILTAQAMGEDINKTLKTASAMQTSEEWILNHDDIEDNSPLRRGKPSLHELYGDALAINAGDALHAIMWKILIDNLEILGHSKTLEIMDEFYKIILRTTLGQTMDIKWFTDKKPEISDEEWYLVADSKSSYYTIAAPLRLGGIIANATHEQLGALSKLGLYMGRSFQLVDDLLDATSDFSGLKQKGNDIYEGKRTLIIGHTLRTANNEDKKKIINILNKNRNEKSQEEVEWVIRKMEYYESISYAKKLAKDYKEKAEEFFEKDLKFLSHQPYRDNMLTIFDFILDRDH
jgi:geranylgeranyl diphosphate synthase, type II